MTKSTTIANQLRLGLFDQQTVIYALRDPRTKQIRYVGKAINPRERLKQHIKGPGDTSTRAWIDQLLVLGLEPELVIIEVVTNNSWRAAERRWIHVFKRSGAQLLNRTDGGDGCAGLDQNGLMKAATIEYLCHPLGISDAELSRALNISRSSAWRLRKDLPVIRVTPGRYTMLPTDLDTRLASAIFWRNDYEYGEKR